MRETPKYVGPFAQAVIAMGPRGWSSGDAHTITHSVGVILRPLGSERLKCKPRYSLARLCVQCVCGLGVLPLAPSLGSIDSASDRPVLFAGFAATVEGSDFSGSFIIGYAPRLPDTDRSLTAAIHAVQNA